MDVAPSESLSLRSYRADDSAACRRLFIDGLVNQNGQAVDDPGCDIDTIEATYLKTPGGHFWVVELCRAENLAPVDGQPGGVCPAGTLVGMIGVERHDAGTAEIRRLRVDGRFRRRGIGSLLVEESLRFCHRHQYLRVILDTFMERDGAMKLFQKFHFQYGRTRPGKRQDRHYFYLDLYGGVEPAEHQV